MAGGVSPTRSKSVITDEIKVRKRFTDIALLFSITYVSERNREQSIIKVICDCVFEHGKHRSEHKQGENDWHRAEQAGRSIYPGEVSYKERTIIEQMQYRFVTDQKNPPVPICRLTKKNPHAVKHALHIFFTSGDYIRL